MKNSIQTIHIFIFALVLLLGCKEQKKQEDETAENRTQVAQKTTKDTAQLTLDGKTYVYNNINWEKSRVKYDGEDVRLTLRQEKLPRIRFRFPDIHKSLERQSEFKMPDVLRGGKSGGYFNSPITLSFQVYEKPEDIHPKGVVSFHKGKLTANFENGRLHVEFEGEGRKALVDEREYFPVSGTIDINL